MRQPAPKWNAREPKRQSNEPRLQTESSPNWSLREMPNGGEKLSFEKFNGLPRKETRRIQNIYGSDSGKQKGRSVANSHAA